MASALPAVLEPDRLAAIDLGSNSFHMVIARVVGGEPVMLDRLREQIQLAAGLEANGHLREDFAARALGCLQRFGERLRGFPPQQVRAVGTSTLRRISDGRAFLRRAEAALGHHIEVIPGTEEARLIYLGVAHTLADDGESRLVVDIGGGSTECILGRRFEAYERHSLHMGCVEWSKRYFASGELSRAAFERATTAARLELRAVERRLRTLGWQQAVGSSGTIRAVGDIAREAQLSARGIDLGAVREIERRMIEGAHVERLDLPGLKEERASVLPGGLAILRALFEALEMEVLSVSQGALRDGVIYDLLGRIRHEDVRERTIKALQERGRVDLEQAARVERSALELLAQVVAAWDLEGEPSALFLAWAARVHEIGLEISWSHNHRHAAYLVENSDMPGFSREDQLLLAAILRNSRRTARRSSFSGLSREDARIALRLSVLLRLALVLHRSRSSEAPPHLRLGVGKKGLLLEFPPGWLASRALLRADLEEEAHAVEPLGIELRWG
ncbi:MAG: exopolyphosphatase [Planctomycetes bacterium]|nr:exopolyphosphatase [Planctomycetota bacterium]